MHPGKQHAVRLVLQGQAVAQQNHGVHPGVSHGADAVHLLLQAIVRKAGGHHRHPAPGSLHGDFGNPHALLKVHVENLAGLAGGEQAVHPVINVPVHQRAQRGLINLPFLGEGGQHHRPYAAGILFHKATSCVLVPWEAFIH